MPLDGVMRLDAQYEAFGRPAVMVFHTRRSDLAPPTAGDCLDMAQMYGLWENDGLGFGYTLVRHQFSFFTRCNVHSVDLRSRASFIDVPFSRQGQQPQLGSFLLQTAAAPLFKWKVGVDNHYHGRTYCVGVALPQIFVPDDRELLPGLVGGDVATQMRALISATRSVAGFTLVSVYRTSRRGLGVPPYALDITTGDMPSLYCASQERRGRQRRG